MKIYKSPARRNRGADKRAKERKEQAGQALLRWPRTAKRARANRRRPDGARLVTRPRRSPKVPHLTRPDIHGPAHVVLRIRRGLPWLRTPKTHRVLERAFRNSKKKDGFRLIEYSVQQNHLHLVVEADHRRKLTRGMQGLMIRIAKALNRFWRRRLGHVFADRYFALAIVHHTQLWRTLRYVRMHGRKHGVWLRKDQPDPYSSGRWLTRWCQWDSVRRPLRSRPVEFPRKFETLTVQAISLNDLPGPRRYDDD